MLSVVQEKQSLLKWSELRKSDKFRDSWALLYGHNIMGCTSALSALVLSFYGKHHFSISPLRSLIFTQFPALNLSLVSTMVLSAKAIDTSSLKFQYDRCDLCMYLKGALIHVFGGVVVPICVNFMICSGMSVRYCTYPRKLIKTPQDLVSYWKSYTRAYRYVLPYALAMNCFYGFIVPYFMVEQRDNILNPEIHHLF